MITLQEFCDRYRVSHKKAKRMASDGVLNVDKAQSADVVRIREALIQHNPISAADLCLMIESPGIILDLGRYAKHAANQLEPIGDARRDAAPKEIVASISDAARGDPEAVAALVGWIKSVLPAEPVGHAWIACRLLMGLPENTREFDVPRIPRALRWCRKSDDFAGWWTYGIKSGRKISLYCRLKNPVAGFDL